jgi:hypothetical protein
MPRLAGSDRCDVPADDGVEEACGTFARGSHRAYIWAMAWTTAASTVSLDRMAPVREENQERADPTSVRDSGIQRREVRGADVLGTAGRDTFQ